MPRIVGGENALPGEWPWQAMLFYIPGNSVYCGGTLIGPRHVISAAHCFEGTEFSNKQNWKVILGKYLYDRYEVDSTEEPVEFNIVTLTMHENYNVGIELDNDIALLEIDGQAPVNDYINEACLDTNGTAHFNESSYCFVTGWGSLSGNVATYADVLQEALVPLLPFDLCNHSYSGGLSDNMMCAGYFSGGIDACQGDSGGPLVCMHGSSQEDPGRWYLVGVVSWGIDCAAEGYPGVYTVVKNYFDWIRTHGGIP
ncbi:trypsin I-P1-like [Ptychodera flava]